MNTELRVFKAVANEKRMKMIELLRRRGRMLLKDISRIMAIPEATACRNLKILENAGLIKSEIRNGVAGYWINRDKSLSAAQKVLNIFI